MARLGNRQVKTRVSLALFGTTDLIDPRVAILQLFKPLWADAHGPRPWHVGRHKRAGTLPAYAETPTKSRCASGLLSSSCNKGSLKLSTPVTSRHNCHHLARTDQQPLGRQFLIASRNDATPRIVQPTHARPW